MAFGQGKDSNQVSGSGFKRYFGVGLIKVVAFNPTMAQWNEITGGNIQKEPEYTMVNAEGIKQAKVTLLLQVDPEKTIGNINAIIPVTFWFKKAPVKGSKSGKYQVIDKYGRTAWATEEEIKSEKIPQYSNGPANIAEGYRRIVTGEEAFTNFLKAHMGIPALSYRDKKTGMIVTHPNPSECEARLDNIMKIFDGDFTEIKKILDIRPDNQSKMLFGVKKTDDGKEYQDVLMECFLSKGNPDNTKFAQALAEAVQGGSHAYDNTYFGEFNPNGTLITLDLQERVVTPTAFADAGQEAPEAEAPAGAVPPKDENDDLPF